MRFMVFVKGTDQGPPPQSFIDAIERAAAEAKSAGTLMDTGGLVPATLGPRIRVEGGEITDVVDVSPGHCFACALGGPDRRTLFLLCGTGFSGDAIRSRTGTIQIVEVDVPGAGWP